MSWRICEFASTALSTLEPRRLGIVGTARFLEAWAPSPASWCTGIVLKVPVRPQTLLLRVEAEQAHHSRSRRQRL